MRGIWHAGGVGRATAAVLLVLLLGGVGEWQGLWRPLETWSRDHAVSSAARSPSAELLIVAIDETSQQKLGPWSRALQARLVERLAQAGARTIVLGEPLSGRENGPALDELQRLAALVATDPSLARHPELPAALSRSYSLLETDATLVRAMTQHGRVLIAASAADRLSEPLVKAAWAVGSAELTPDRDGVLRQQALRLPGAGAASGPLPSLAWLAAQAHGGLPGPQTDPQQATAPRLNDRLFAIDGQAVAIQPIYAQGTASRVAFATWSAWDVLDPARAVPRLDGRLVLVGRITRDDGLLHASNGLPMSRVEAQAHLASSLLTGQLLRPAAFWGGAPWLLLGAVAVYLVWAWRHLRRTSTLAAGLALAIGLLLFSHLLVRLAQVWLPVAMPVGVLLAGLGLLTVWRSVTRSWGQERPQASASTLFPDAVSTLEMPMETQQQLDGFAGPSVLGLPAASAPVAVAGSPAVSAVQQELAAVASWLTASVGLARRSRLQGGGTAERSDPQTLPMEYSPSELGALAAAGEAAQQRLPRLSRYRVLRELGRGTMGRVYLARDRQSGQAVALKTLRLSQEFEGYALREARERFQREAQAASRLHHPDIVTVLDAGEENGLAYIAMELLKGQDLSDLVQPATLLPMVEAVRIAARVAEALAHAHALGVVHRDIKPANVMVDRSTDQVKVTDFGVARLHDASRTRTGLVLGSPAYMSPEQLVGRTVDGRSDLYSLGVLLFQMLTGELPISGHTVGELMQAVAHQPAPDLRRMRAGVPESLADVVSILLEKRPELRYRDGAEVAADLYLVVQELQAPDRPAGPGQAVAASVEEVAARTPLTPFQEAKTVPIRAKSVA